MQAYRDAGADLLFVESPENEDELERVGASFDRPVIANMVEGGRTPVLQPRPASGRWDSRSPFSPRLGFLAAAEALKTRLHEL